MSEGPTVRRPIPSPPPPPPPQPARTGRARRRLVIAGAIVLGLAGLLVGLDRAAAAYAENRIASEIQSYGFPSKPSVTVEGFPFLTQIITRHLDGIRISSNGLRAGPVTASIDAHATGIVLNSGYHGGTIAHVTGTALIAFSSLASMASAQGVPGVTFSRAGAHAVRLTANLAVTSLSAIARVKQTGPDTFKIHIVSTGGIPLSVLGGTRNFTVRIPTLPLGLSVQSLQVSEKGVVVNITGSNISFGQ